MEGFLVNYERVPVTDEKSPKESDFDMLVFFILVTFTLLLVSGFRLCIFDYIKPYCRHEPFERHYYIEV